MLSFLLLFCKDFVMPGFALLRKTREPRVHLLLDLDETLITGPEHWKKASLAGVLTMARSSNGLRLENPAYIRKFNSWVGWEAEKLREDLSQALGSPVSHEEAFFFHVLRSEIYSKNPNDRKQFDKLVERVAPGLKSVEVETHGGGLCACHSHSGPVKVRVNRARDLAQAAAAAYRHQRDLNVQNGVLAAMPQAPQALSRALAEGMNVAIASVGDRDKQEWKAHNLVLNKVEGSGKIPVFTTERRFLGWRLKPGVKTPRFLKGLKKKLGVKKGDFVIMVGDRHDSDVVPALKAGFDYVVHVPGRRDEAYRKGKKQSQAHLVANDLSEGMEKIMARVRAFRSEGK